MKSVVWAIAAVVLLVVACGGGTKQTESKAAAASPPASPAPPQGGSPPSPGAAIPLVDSRGNPVPGMPPAAPGGQEAGLHWTAPPSWVEEPPSSSMRIAQYSLPPAEGDAEPGQCAVFYFGPGQGGDVKANVDRWASQFSDSAGAHPAPKITEGSVAGMKVMKVFTEGTYSPGPMMGGDTTPKPGQMLLGAIVEGPEANWFFKCTGAKKTMEAHRAAFDALIDSAHPR